MKKKTVTFWNTVSLFLFLIIFLFEAANTSFILILRTFYEVLSEIFFKIQYGGQDGRHVVKQLLP